MYLATTGVDSIINIFDRYGEVQERIRLSSLCQGFAWDNNGDLLAMISQGPELILWDSNTNRKNSIDIGLKDALSCLVWAKKTYSCVRQTFKKNHMWCLESR
nr:unnamed protein product [Callosobruchus chinensis]